MEEQRSSYRQILGTTSLFGGIQVFNILISIIRSKFVAILLGPFGMGISGLFLTWSDTIAGLTNFGLGTSGVKSVAAADAEEDKRKLEMVVTVLKRLMWFTGLLGAIVMIILSPFLSQFVFGSKEYTFGFIFLSVSMLFRQLAAGENVIMQGKRQLKSLAKANLLGSVLSLIVTVSLYYLFGLDGIVPGLIAIAVIAFVSSYFYSRKIKINRLPLTLKETWNEGKGMITLGFMLSLSYLITILVSSLVRVYISNTGGVEDVGLYHAGTTILIVYTGLIFTAMSIDYFPRLSRIANDNTAVKEMINQQAEIAILILAPILMIFFVFIQWVVQLLYSEQFLPINEMIVWGALGMYFKAASWAIAFLFLAKGASKLFLINEILSNAFILILSIIFYQWKELDGLGMSLLASYVIYLVQVFIICNRKYQFRFNSGFIKIFGIQIVLAILCFCTVEFLPTILAYISGSCLIVVSGIFSLIELNKRIAIKDLITSKLLNKKNG